MSASKNDLKLLCRCISEFPVLSSSFSLPKSFVESFKINRLSVYGFQDKHKFTCIPITAYIKNMSKMSKTTYGSAFIIQFKRLKCELESRQLFVLILYLKRFYKCPYECANALISIEQFYQSHHTKQTQKFQMRVEIKLQSFNI